MLAGCGSRAGKMRGWGPGYGDWVEIYTFFGHSQGMQIVLDRGKICGSDVYHLEDLGVCFARWV